MNEQAHQVILEHFCKQRKLSQEYVPKGLADTICATSAPYFLMIECLDSLDPNDPTGGLLVTLIDRTYETAAAALTLIALGHLREAEILSRSILESSITTSFIAIEDPAIRLSQFFETYIKQEREQNRKWEDDLEHIPDENKADHEHRIIKKNEALDIYENFVKNYKDQYGDTSKIVKKWPSLIDRFTALGKRIDYRTFYAAMCSQTHHDAEDILNNFFVNSVPGADKYSNRMKDEADNFSVFLVLFSLKCFIDSVGVVCIHLKFPTVVEEAKQSRAKIYLELNKFALCLDTCRFPSDWKA